jgi:hypothetical protein
MKGIFLCEIKANGLARKKMFSYPRWQEAAVQVIKKLI